MIISPLAALITSISSVSWGVFDGFRKHLIEKLNHWTLLFYLSSFFSICFLAWILINQSFVFDHKYWVYGLTTVILNFLANYFYIKGIEISEISSSVPFLAFTSLFTALSSFLILGETLNLIQVFGILIIVLSSFFINYKSGLGIKKIFQANKGALLMILVSLLWAISAPFDKIAVSHSNVATHSFLQSFFISIINLFMVLKFARQRIISDLFILPRSLFAGSIIAATALGLQFYAYTLMPVSIFESSKRALAIITAFLVSAVFFKEKISKIKIIATLTLILGVFLVINMN